MSAQNCTIGKARGRFGDSYVVIETKRNTAVIDQCTANRPCKPGQVVGYPFEICEVCSKHF